ncbi:MAG TPA: DinB family protein [Candidatus Limnocylindria bacterium]|nr:DinB family protein [Candidatus Limnocylindria bacterium]
MTVTPAVERLVRASIRLSDADLDRTYVWEEYDDDGLRFALLTAHHLLRETHATVAADRLGAGKPFSEAQRILAQVHEAYRDLTGALAGTGEDELDAAPPNEQWPIREVLRHVLGAETGFLAATLVALGCVRSGRPSEPDEAAWKAKRQAPEDPRGSRADALDALFRSHVTILRALDGVTDTELATPSWFWEDKGYPIRFRMHRFEEHLRQHTIQVDKTLAALGHPPTEAERLVRNLYNALAGVESVTGAGVGHELLDACAASIDAIAAEVERIGR